jgi:hypothetical protein
MNKKIDPNDLLEFQVVGNELWYPYTMLYDFWEMSENDDTLNPKIPKPKHPLDETLTYEDAWDLANRLAHLGYIG